MRIEIDREHDRCPMMRGWRKILRHPGLLLVSIAGAAFFAGMIVLYNLQFSLLVGNPAIPKLESRWWGGYYETETFGRQWCLARFAKDPSGRLRMALISPSGEPNLLTVERSSSDGNFVRLRFTSPDGIRIEAKQLYYGKKYILQRLIAGRIKDFWKKNEDISIRGSIVSVSPSRAFALEPISDRRLLPFWTAYVRPGEIEPGPEELLARIGFAED